MELNRLKYKKYLSYMKNFYYVRKNHVYLLGMQEAEVPKVGFFCSCENPAIKIKIKQLLIEKSGPIFMSSICSMYLNIVH